VDAKAYSPFCQIKMASPSKSSSTQVPTAEPTPLLESDLEVVSWHMLSCQESCCAHKSVQTAQNR
jgi:hypothetical protein